MKVATCLLVHGLLTMAVTSEAPAQTYQGGLRGVVRDTSDAILPGSSVTLTNEVTSVAHTMVTNERGEYVFASLSPGTYSLNVDLSGFAPYTSSGLELGIRTFSSST